MEINSDSKNAHLNVAMSLATYMLSVKQTPIIVCVGCSRVVGDSLAPVIGHILKNKYKVAAYIYGDLTFNITAQNLKQVLYKIKNWHKDVPIIIVDATLGNLEDIGNIKYYKGGCYPAGVYNSNTHKYGDYCILGVVGNSATTKSCFLDAINMDIVLKLAKSIAHSIAYAYKVVGAISTI